MKNNLIIDGSNLIMISLSVTKDDVTNSNEFLGGFTGFLKILQGLINQFYPHSIFVVFDKGKSAYRQKLYPDYKKGRHSGINDKDLLYRWEHREEHTSLLRIMLGCLGVNVIEMQNVEGDDIISNFVTQSKRKNIIVSTDKDFIQLINSNISVYRPGKLDMLITSSNVVSYCKRLFKIKDMDFKQEWLTGMRILTGDNSDNIPGADGVGEIRSIQLFNECDDNPSNILNHLKPKKKLKWHESIIDFIESGKWELNSALMDLKRGPKIPVKELIHRSKYNYLEAYNFLNNLHVTDFMFDDDINRLISAYECLTN